MATAIEARTKNILEGNIWKTLLLISLPVAISSMVTEIFALFDVYFSKLIGDTQLTATVFVSPITQLILSISTGLGVAATALIAKNISIKDYKKAKNIAVQMIIIGLIISAILLFVTFTFSYQILSLAGASELIIEEAVVYFKIIVLSLPLRFFGEIYFGQQRAIGNNKKILYTNLTSIVLKFIANYLFIVVLGYGITGLGLATIVSSSIIAIFAFFDFFIKKSEIKLSYRDIKFDFRAIYIIIIFSLPIILEKSTQSFGNVIINSFASGISDNVLTAFGIINRINSIIFSFAAGFGVALVAIVSQNLGVKQVERIHEATKKGLVLSVSIMIGLLIIVFSLQDLIIEIYASDNAELADTIRRGMNIYTISAIPWAVMHIYFGVFQGLRKTQLVFVISVIRLWIFRVLLVWILLNFTNMGEYAIWYGYLISNNFAMIAAIVIYIILRQKKVIENIANGIDTIY